MSEKMIVEPAPVQRNVFDVAVELTIMHFEKIGYSSKEEFEKQYVRYFATAKCLNELSIKALSEFADDEVKKEVQAYYSR